jgi:hypothetical protein
MREAYDVIVVGGGAAGITAAVAAARNGCRTLLIERYGFLGGELATGLPMLTFHDFNGRQVIKGLAQELVDRLIKEDGSAGHVLAPGTHVYSWTPSYPEIFKYVAQEMLLESGVELLLHSYVTGVVKNGNELAGVVVDNKSGKQVYSAQCFIDATGDGDVAAFGGAEFAKGRQQDGRLQPATMMFSLSNVDVKDAAEQIRSTPDQPVRMGDINGQWIRVLGSFSPWKELVEKEKLFLHNNQSMAMFSLRDREVTFNTAKVINIDGTNAEDLTRGEIEGRRQVIRIARFLKKHVRGFEKSHLSWTAPHIGIRETRRIIGEYVLTKEDIMAGERPADSVACSAYGIDVHNPTGEIGSVAQIEKTVGYYGIPYRCLVPVQMDRLLVAGRCISCTNLALGSVRVIVVCMATGQAAGTAAAVATAAGCLPRNIDVVRLRKLLQEQGAVIG